MNIYLRKVASEGINHHVEHCIFVPASRVLFSSRCPTFRVSLLSSSNKKLLGTKHPLQPGLDPPRIAFMQIAYEGSMGLLVSDRGSGSVRSRGLERRRDLRRLVLQREMIAGFLVSKCG